MKKLSILFLYILLCTYVILEDGYDYRKTVSLWQDIYKDTLYTIIADNKTINSINKKVQDDRNIDITKLEDYDNKTFQNIIKEKITNKNYYHKIKNQINYTLINNITNTNIKYAINIGKHSLKTIPKTLLEIKEKNEKPYDFLTEININFAEPIAIVHYTSNKKWAFVLTLTGSGWIETKNLALTSKSVFLKYLKMEKQSFIVNIDKIFSLKSTKMEMGTRLILNKEDKDYFYAYLPTKNKQQHLVEKIVKIRKNNKFHHGYLVYNVNNLIKQILKFKNAKYGWGETYEGKDYDGYSISRIFRTFGLNIPEKSKKLQNISNNFSNIEYDENDNLIDELKIGDLLYIKNYMSMLIYLGKINNKDFVLHSVDFIEKSNKKNIMKVVIDTFDKKMRNTKVIKQNITNITRLR